MPPKPEIPPELPARDQLLELAERARAGDREVRPVVQELLDRCPEIWQAVGDMAAQAEIAQIELAAQGDLLVAESLTRKLAELKGELGAESASPLERLLIERVVISWLQAVYADVMLARTPPGDPRRTDFLQKRKDRAQNGHLAAIKQLATVRKLLQPSRRGGYRPRRPKPEASEGTASGPGGRLDNGT